MLFRPSDELSTKASQWPLDHFYPCAVGKMIARFHHAISRGNLLEGNDLIGMNGLWFRDPDDTDNARYLEDRKGIDQSKSCEAIARKQWYCHSYFSVRPLAVLRAQWKKGFDPDRGQPISSLFLVAKMCLKGIPLRVIRQVGCLRAVDELVGFVWIERRIASPRKSQYALVE